jgi:signal transduction histidine kinase/ActR/RegA family two-component response regulator
MESGGGEEARRAREHYVLSRQLDANFKNLLIVLVASPLAGGLAAWPLAGHVSSRLLYGWILELSIASILALWLRAMYMRRNHEGPLELWSRVRVLSAALLGFAWGAYPAFAFWIPERPDLELQMLIIVNLTSVGALASSGVYFPAFAAYTITCNLPSVVRLLFVGGPLLLPLAAEICVLVTVLIVGGSFAHQRDRKQLLVMRDNELLVKSLRRAEEGLIRANRLLNERVESRTRELAQALEEKHRSELSLLRSQKMEAIGRLAGGVAHDFNNVLTGIMGSASILAASLPESLNDERAEIEEIVKGAERAARLTAQLLSLARGGFCRPVRLDVGQHLRQLAHLLKRAVGENYRLEIVTPEEVCVVWIDPGQFDQVVMNLVLNAKDASPPGARILVSLEMVQAHLSPQKGRPTARLRVQDEGSGIPAEIKERIFEPFFTTKGDRGSGLGLTTCFGIVERAEGHISLESEPGRGSAFSVFLPLLDEEPSTEASHIREAPLVWELDTVLVVEDQEAVLRVVSKALERGGAKVILARTAEEALAQFDSGLTNLDLVVSDVLLPRQSGPDLIRSLRARGYSGPCLLMSGYIEEDMIEDRSTGARFPVLPKPFTSLELNRAIARAVATRSSGTKTAS